MMKVKKMLETRENLQGLYWFMGNSCEPVEPLKEPLTPDNFGIILNDKVYTVDDFRWYKEDGSDRYYFRYDDTYSNLASNELPPEVFIFLNNVIGAKFAMRCLLRAKEIMDASNNDEAKQSLDYFISIFTKEDINQAKLLIATDALSSASKALENVNRDFSCELNKYATLIAEVYSEIANKQQNLNFFLHL